MDTCDYILLTIIVALVCQLVESGTQMLIWPLNRDAFTLEKDEATNGNILCGINFTSGPPNYPSAGAVRFMSPMTVNLTVSGVEPTPTDYAFSGLFQFASTTGTLLHYRDDSENFQIKVWCENGYLFSSRELDSPFLSESKNTNVALDIGRWYYISVGYAYGGGGLHFKVIDSSTGSELSTMSFDTQSDVNFLFPGIVKLGGMFDDSRPHLNGSVTCFAFFLGEKTPDERLAKEECNAYTPTTNLQNQCTTVAGQSTTEAEQSTTDARQSTTYARQSTTNAEQSTTDAEQSTTDARQSTSDAGQSTTDTEQSTTNTRQSTSNAGQSTTNAGQSTTDARQSTTDAGQSNTDAVRSTTDAGQSTTNAGQRTTDAEQSTTDAGQSTTDAEQSTNDAGQSTTDAGQSTTDAGQSTTDTGQSTTDAGQSTTDAGQNTADAGQSTTNATQSTTCAGQSTTDAEQSTTNSGYSAANVGQSTDVSLQSTSVAGQSTTEAGQNVTDAGQRQHNHAEVFKLAEGVNMNSLTQIASVLRCSEIQCAYSCMINKECWFHKLMATSSGCGPCLLFSGEVITNEGNGGNTDGLYRLNTGAINP